MSALDALLGRLYADGVSLELRGALNFAGLEVSALNDASNKPIGWTISAAGIAADVAAVGQWTEFDAWTVPFECWPYTEVLISDDGASTGIPTPFGTPVSETPIGYRVKITTGGIEGTAVFSVSDDTGATYYITGVTVPDGAGLYVIPGSGITLYFTPGTYVLNEYFGWSTVFAAIGNGSIVGCYRIVGNAADVSLVFTMGTTTDLGGGVASPTSMGIVVPLPPGFEIDLSRLPTVAAFGDFRATAFPLFVNVAGVSNGTVGVGLSVGATGLDRAFVPTATIDALANDTPTPIFAYAIPIKAT